jgi:hypothetical protein
VKVIPITIADVTDGRKNIRRYAFLKRSHLALSVNASMKASGMIDPTDPTTYHAVWART